MILSFLNGAALFKLSSNDIKKRINNLCLKYPHDLDPVDFLQEAESFKFQAKELF